MAGKQHHVNVVMILLIRPVRQFLQRKTSFLETITYVYHLHTGKEGQNPVNIRAPAGATRRTLLECNNEHAIWQ
jgi:hypothetical protein